MVVYFDNDGTYAKDAEKHPILVNDKPIGFISEVNEERVTCYLWDDYVYKIKRIDADAGNVGKRKFYGIGIRCE